MLQVTDASGPYPVDVGAYFKELVRGFSVTASLVADDNGSTISSSGSSAGLGNATDLALLIALRRQSKVILTTGKTFRSDQYKFPKHADLAVLTSQGIDVTIPEGQRLLLSSSDYEESLKDLAAQGYKHVHVEYGITGIKALIKAESLGALFLSSKTQAGLLALAKDLGVQPVFLALEDLYVGLVAWQPSGKTVAR